MRCFPNQLLVAKLTGVFTIAAFFSFVHAQEEHGRELITASPLEVPSSIAEQKKLLELDFALIEVEDLRKEADAYEVQAKQAILDDKDAATIGKLRTKSRSVREKASVVADRFRIGELEGLAPTYHSRLRTRGLLKPSTEREGQTSPKRKASDLKPNSGRQSSRLDVEKPNSLLVAACNLAESAALVLNSGSKIPTLEKPLREFRAELEQYRRILENAVPTASTSSKDVRRRMLECELIVQSLDKIEFATKPK